MQPGLDIDQKELLTRTLDSLRVSTTLLETVLAESKVETPSEKWRRRPSGPLNESGEAEIERRFAAGHRDSDIALEMKISLTGVAKRRTLWRRSRAR
jgi:hypothetical protein